MPPAEPLPKPPKLTASPFWKWMMRLTAAVTLALFLTPTFYVGKYYALDLPREKAIAGPHGLQWLQNPHNPDDLLAETHTASRPLAEEFNPAQRYRIQAIQAMGQTLRLPEVRWKRPMECLSAKAALADLAAKDAEPQVRAAASEELAQIAQGGRDPAAVSNPGRTICETNARTSLYFCDALDRCPGLRASYSYSAPVCGNALAWRHQRRGQGLRLAAVPVRSNAVFCFRRFWALSVTGMGGGLFCCCRCFSPVWTM